MSLKLSQITSGGALAPTSDQLVAVRSGATDVLVTPGQAASKAVSNNTNPTVASVALTTININHLAIFSDTAGTIQDGGVAGSAANAAASSATGTVAAVNGGTTIGHLAVFADTAGTIQDGGAPGSGFVPTSRTVNGHALTADVVVSASDITTGILPSAQLPTATTGVLGAVKVDGTTITISGGVISASGGGPAFVAGSGTATASGTNAFAAGGNASASGSQSVAVGLSASVTSGGTQGVAIGDGASITASAGTALGGSSSVAGVNGVAVGNGAVVHNANSVCIGAVADLQAGDIVIGNGNGSLRIAVNGTTGNITIPTGGTLLTTSSTLTNGAAAQTATFTNSPVSGNPTKWIPINDNGTIRYIPAF